MNGQKVRRITIDERLAEDLIRILVAELKPGKKVDWDDPTCWEEEKEFLVGKEDWEKMGIPEGTTGECSWDNLYEGQVCPSGEFEKRAKKGIETIFMMTKEQEKGLKDIDEQSKEHVKGKYLAALEGGS
jgi:hypothetical protein